MHLSLWTIESREFITEWCTANSAKVPLEIISSWQNMHRLALERGREIKSIKGKELSVFCAECCDKMYLVLLVPYDETRISLGNTVVQEASYIISMMSDVGDCVLLGDYRAAVSSCSWSLKLLLSKASCPCSLVPWSLISSTPETILAHLSPLMKTCLEESLPTPLSCLVSHERLIASTSSWDLLPAIEQISLTLFLRSRSPISESIVRLTSQPEKPLYRFIQIELVKDVALLMLCGSQSSLGDIRSKVTQYWSPMTTELRSFQPYLLLYSPLDLVPESLYAFFQLSLLGGQCTSGYLRLNSSLAYSVEESMKRLLLECKSTKMSLSTSCIVIVEKESNMTFVIKHSDEGRKSLILTFIGRLEGTEARSMTEEISEMIDHWLRSKG